MYLIYLLTPNNLHIPSLLSSTAMALIAQHLYFSWKQMLVSLPSYMSDVKDASLQEKVHAEKIVDEKNDAPKTHVTVDQNEGSVPSVEEELAGTAKARFSTKDYSDHMALERAFEGWKDAEREGIV